jgi:hypothetical protein
MEWEEAILAWEETNKLESKAQWQRGDIALALKPAYGEQTLAKFAETVGVEYKQLLQYRWVASEYESSVRTELSWTHHERVAARPDRLEWLKKAEAGKWSVHKMLTEAKAPLPIDGDWSFTHHRLVEEALPGQPELQEQVIQKAQKEGLSHTQVQEVAKAVKQAPRPDLVPFILKQPITLTAKELTDEARAERLLTKAKPSPKQQQIEFEGKWVGIYIDFNKTISLLEYLLQHGEELPTNAKLTMLEVAKKMMEVLYQIYDLLGRADGGALIIEGAISMPAEEEETPG